MATVGDISFTFDSTTYDYMLAQDENGQKAWRVRQLFMQPPSLLKDKIDMTILAAPETRDTTEAIVTDKSIATVLVELRVLADKTSAITLTGFDGQTYKVLFDQSATNIKSILDPTGRITHYTIDLSCWNLYQP